MRIQTVTGNISPETLGVTLPHEHIIIDYRKSWVEPPTELEYLTNEKVTQGLMKDIRCYAHSSKDNLILDDEDVAVDELLHFRNAGGNSVVELSNIGLSIDPEKLRRISEKANINIIVGCGYYRFFSQPDNILQMKAPQLVEVIIKSLQEGIGDSNVRAGIIGEVGTSYPLHPFEYQSLIAAAQAQRKTGYSINIHPEILAYQHLNILQILEDAGADLSRVIMSHMDEPNNPEWILKVAARGVYISFDTFGYDFPFDGVEKPQDTDRIRCLLTMLDAGYLDRALLSHDVCYKMQQKRFGGTGYSHILENIIPILRKQGVSEDEINTILVKNPARFLTV